MFSIKSSFRSLLKGFKKAYQTPTLPAHIITLNNHIFIRIMRVLGGISFLTILSKSYLNYPIFVLFIAMFFALILTCYHTYLTYHRIKHIKYLLKSDKLEVRNSPLDRLAFLAAKTLTCLKGACESAPHIGMGLSLMLVPDPSILLINSSSLISLLFPCYYSYFLIPKTSNLRR